MTAFAAAREWGLAFIGQIQALAPGLGPPMEAVSALGRTEAYLVLLPFVFWVADRRLALLAMLLLIGNDVLGSALKLLLHEPRPYWLQPAIGWSAEHSYGIPSSHASGSLVVWGFLALRSGRRGWVAAVAGLLLLMGFSRVALGVHFPHDVLAGWVAGGIVLWAGLRFAPALAGRAAALGPGALAAWAAGASLAVLLAGVACLSALQGVPDDPAWREPAARARSLAPFFTAGGAILGLLLGHDWMRRARPWRPAAGRARRWAAFALGLAGMMALYLGLARVFAPLAGAESPAGLALRFLRHGIVGAWITAFAPWLFLRLGLARPAG